MARLKSNPFLHIAVALISATFAWHAVFYLNALVFGGPYRDYRLERHTFNAVAVFLLLTPTILLAWRFLIGGSWKELGLGEPRSAVMDFPVGMATWLIPAILGLALCLSLGWVSYEQSRPISELLTFSAFLLVLVFLYEALPEELLFRGFVYARLATRLSGYGIVLAQAVLFAGWGAVIGAAESIERVGFFFVVAWILGALRMVTGSVWMGIGFHAAFQTVAQLALNPSYGFLLIEGVTTLQIVAFGVLPFLCAELFARLWKRSRAPSEGIG